MKSLGLLLFIGLLSCNSSHYGPTFTVRNDSVFLVNSSPDAMYSITISTPIKKDQFSPTEMEQVYHNAGDVYPGDSVLMPLSNAQFKGAYYVQCCGDRIYGPFLKSMDGRRIVTDEEFSEEFK